MTLNVASFSAVRLFWLELSQLRWPTFSGGTTSSFCLPFCNAFVIYLFLPDTLGLSLEEMSGLFGDDITESDSAQEAMENEDEGEK
jgi:hypothetical protein